MNNFTNFIISFLGIDLTLMVVAICFAAKEKGDFAMREWQRYEKVREEFRDTEEGARHWTREDL